MKSDILFITSRLPYPPIRGDKTKYYNLLKILSKNYNVHLVTITDEVLDAESLKFIKEYTTNFKVFSKPKYRFTLNVIKSLWNRLPMQINYYYFKDVQNYILNESKKTDIIFATVIRTVKYCFPLDKPKIVELADSIGLNYMNSIRNTKSLFWRFIYMLEGRRLFKFEKLAVEKFDASFFVNPFELEHFNKDKAFLLQTCVDKTFFGNYNKINHNYDNSICFFGSMAYQPNILAVEWFVQKVFPYLNEEINFIIVGSNPVKQIKDLSIKFNRIKVTGFVEDPFEIINSCFCSVASMQTGAGIQTKILESMALGSIVITTTLSSKALLNVRNNEELIILDEPKAMAEKINDIFENRESYKLIKSQAKEYIFTNYTWDKFEKIIIEKINNILL